MKLYLADDKKITIFKILNKTEKSITFEYKYGDTTKIPILLEKKDDNWFFKRNDYVNVVQGDYVIEEAMLQEYTHYYLRINGSKELISMFVLPTKEAEIYDLNCEQNSKITIGANQNSNIYYYDGLMQDLHCEIIRENQEAKLVVPNDSAKVYLNNKRITAATLKTGDIIFINGLKIIWVNTFIRINNPGKKVKIQGFQFQDSNNLNNSIYELENELEEVVLYNKDEYFSPKFHVSNKLVEEVVEIDSPPDNQLKEELPMMLQIGSSVTMLSSSFMIGYMVIYNLQSGNSSIARMIPQIVMFFGMLVGGLIMPKLISRYQKKKSKQREKLRQDKYGAYLNKKELQIQQLVKGQEQTLRDNNPSVQECYEILTQLDKITNINFWSRNIQDDNFLTIRLGSGILPSKVIVKAPEEHFSLDDDELLNKVYSIVENSKTLSNVPITLSLTKNNKLGIMLKNDLKNDYIDSLITQLITMQSPINLKIVIFTSENNKEHWNYLRYLPHCWSDDKSIRFFATNSEEMQQISSYLEKEYKGRKEKNKIKKQEDSTQVDAEKEQYQKAVAYKEYEPYYIIIDENYSVSKYIVMTDILLKTAVNYGFSYIGIGNILKDFSNDCTTFLEITEKTGNILRKNINIKDILTFNNEYISNMNLRDVCNKISNVPITTKDGLATLPSTLNFLEMLDVSKIEHLNIANRWKTNNPVMSLAVPIGVHVNGEKFKLDLHEKAHGPHGLVAGMTGSGKSELIITYILSMIINFHPYEVQFVLIDYKGGGLAGAFENKETGVKIPHLVGTITNLDTSEMNRTLVSIQSELKRRQKKFNEVRDKLGESTIDIYKYQKLYREGAIEEPMAHLFIISDEFAELKSQQPEFMSQLISIARIGRSLGVHLILATQKPSGVVNEQIWSNSKFKVCLKVQDRSDSMEMLKKPDAANIKETGRFFLQVGYDDYFDIGQSGWSGAKYIPSNNIIKKKDEALNFVDNVGMSIKTIKDVIKVDNSVDIGDQLTNIVKEICNLGSIENIKTSKLWLDSIPSEIYVQNLKNKYDYKPTPYHIAPIIGEYDNPSEQKQGLLNLELTNSGNTIIYGQTGSGKENLLATIIGSSCLEHTPEEVNFYILDFGSESLKMYNNVPHVGDIVTVENPEKVEDTFNMLFDEMSRRKELFVDYSGSYNDYCENSGHKLPLIVVIINNYEIFVENNSKLSEGIMNIYRDAIKYGIVFVLSVVSTNAIRGKMLQYFNNIICLQLPNEGDYRNIMSAPRGLFPAKVFGRGLCELNDNIYEFQTAMLLDKANITNFVREMAEKMQAAYTTRAKKIPTLPEKVSINLFENKEVNINNVPIGYSIDNKEPYYYDFTLSKYIPIVSVDMSDEKMSFVYAIVNLLNRSKSTNLRIIDLVDVFKCDESIKCYNDDWDNSIVEIYNEIVSSKEGNMHYSYVILGIGQLKKVLSSKTTALLDKLFLEINDNYPVNFLLVDTYVSFKKIQTEVWYQSNVDNSYGIWLGEEVGTQLAINFNNLSLEEKRMYFPYIGYAVKNGNHKIIKHIVDQTEELNEK